ncbi:Protein translocase subunit SecD [Myxococcaceae bacterium]|nr:Protein translocase subunit SecD [Myxococcaceae bacterium]
MSLRTRAILVAGTVLLFAYLATANLFSAETRRAHWWLPDNAMRLGLDLQGGIHWVLGADLDVAYEHELDHMKGQLVEQLAEEQIVPANISVSEDRILAEMATPEDALRLRGLAGETQAVRVVTEDGNRIELGLTEPWKRDVASKGLQQVLEVLRRRIDDPVNGVQDSVVTPQGEDRVLVQIPGGQADRDAARALLTVGGFLEFKIVEDQAPTEELLRAKYPQGIPEDREIVFEKDRTTKRVLEALLVPKAPAITGDYLDDARVAFDNQQRPIVSFTFNPAGGKIFQELTEKNVGKRLAVVVDRDVASAPVIRERIGARGQIDGRFTSQDAANLAIVLRSGSLSIPVPIEEERSVGPALGADSIRSGLRASLVGLVLVAGFAVFYYRLAGGYATIALVANLVMILGVMSAFRATLTLPGIAGLVLTVGMAIDANVIIFERIREELRSGKAVRAAISTGFNKAWITIMDANVTTLISGLVLFQYGTGPIKGFAVTMCIGLVTSVFTAMVVTRLCFDLYPGERRVTALSI